MLHLPGDAAAPIFARVSTGRAPSPPWQPISVGEELRGAGGQRLYSSKKSCSGRNLPSHAAGKGLLRVDTVMLMVLSQGAPSGAPTGSISAAGMQRMDTSAGLSRLVAVFARSGSLHP